MITGQITCHCGQDVPGYLAHAHVKPNGATCEGIRLELHTPGICWECRNGTHSAEFARILDVIAWERGRVTA